MRSGSSPATGHCTVAAPNGPAAEGWNGSACRRGEIPGPFRASDWFIGAWCAVIHVHAAQVRCGRWAACRAGPGSRRVSRWDLKCRTHRLAGCRRLTARSAARGTGNSADSHYSCRSAGQATVMVGRLAVRVKRRAHDRSGDGENRTTRALPGSKDAFGDQLEATRAASLTTEDATAGFTPHPHVRGHFNVSRETPTQR
jgi:hypothetical protein